MANSYSFTLTAPGATVCTAGTGTFLAVTAANLAAYNTFIGCSVNTVAKSFSVSDLSISGNTLTIAGVGSITLNATGATAAFKADAGLAAGTKVAFVDNVTFINTPIDGQFTYNGIEIVGGATAAALTGGTGSDTITGGAAADTLTGKTGKDTFVAGAAATTDTITDYSYSEGDILAGALPVAGGTIAITAAGVATLAMTGQGSLSTAALTATDGTYRVIVNNTGVNAGTGLGANTITEYWKTVAAGATVDASGVSNVINIDGDAGADTISGNAKANIISAGVGSDNVWGGKGTDTITLGGADAAADTVWFGSGDGTDTVTDFQKGFADTDDVVKIYSSTDVTKDVVFTGAANSTLKVGTDVLTLTGVAGAAAQVQLKLQDANNKITKVSYVQNDGTAANFAAGVAATAADVYVGGTNAADLVTYAGNTAGVFANLGDTSVYKSVEYVTGGSGNDTLVGGAVAGTITAGAAGTNQLWGGSSAKHTFVGGAATTDTFWFGAGDGQDSITAGSYTAGTDSIKLYDRVYDKVISGIAVTNDGTNTKVAIGSDTLTLVGTAAAEQKLTILDKNNKAAKVVVASGATITYDETSKLYYGASAQSTTLNVGAGISAVNLYLGNGYTGITTNDIYFADVVNIDASLSTGANIFSGNAAANKITAGSGNTGMWGGGSAADTLVGGAGADSFWFGTGDGKDIVQAATNLDKVVLYTDSISKVTGAVSGSDLVITTTAGDTLTITNWANTAAASQMNTFQVGTDSTATSYKFDTTTKTFVAK